MPVKVDNADFFLSRRITFFHIEKRKTINLFPLFSPTENKNCQRIFKEIILSDLFSQYFEISFYFSGIDRITDNRDQIHCVRGAKGKR
jgi:hypothetical protein